MIYKNTTGQKIGVFAYTVATGAAKTGDAAQITCYESIGFGGANQVDDANPTELDATNMPGWYVFDLTQAETNGEVLIFAPVSATAGVALDQIQVVTEAGTPQTGDSYARLGAPAGASVSADIDALPTAIENADALLKRDWTNVTGEAARSVLNALRFVRNKWSISAGTLTVTKEDDSTAAWTATVATTAGAEPITTVDPA